MRISCWKRLARCLCVCLCITMLGTAIAEDTAAAAPDFPIALPTPTPEQAPSSAAEPVALMSEDDAQTDTPAIASEGDDAQAADTPAPATEPPSPTPAPQESEAADAPTQKPSNPPTQEPTDEPSPEPSNEPSTEPSEAPSEEPSAEPSEEPTPSPSAEPEPSPSAAPAPTQDESPRDSGTPSHPQEPKCDVAGCAHIGVDDNGDVVALCALGKRMLDEADENSGVSLMDASAPTTLILKPGENIIYRSGSYLVTGGAENASLYVRGGLVVSIRLESARMLTLKAAANAKVTLGFSGRNAMETLAAKGASILFDGEGSLAVNTNLNCDRLIVRSGSVRLPEGAVSVNDRLCYPFLAPGAASVLLDGEPFCNVCSDSEGYVYLWLPELPEGFSYRATQTDDVLSITSASALPQDSEIYDLSSGAAFAPEANRAYRLTASDPDKQETSLRVDVEGVSLALAGVGGDASRPSLAAEQALRLHLEGENALNTLNASAPVTLTGAGLLRISSLNAPALHAHGRLTIVADEALTLPQGWQPIAVDSALDAPVTALLDGRKVAVLLTGEPLRAYAPLEPPAAGKAWAATRQGDALLLELVDAKTQTGLLTDEPLALQDGSARLTSQAACAGSMEVAPGAKLTLTLAGVSTKGALRVGEGARVILIAEGSNTLGAIELGKGARLSVEGGGSVLAASASGESGAGMTVAAQTNLSLSSGAALPGSSLKPTVLRVTDESGGPMVNRAVTLKLGTSVPFDTCTAADGRVTLWGKQSLSGVDAVVMNDANTYAAILNDGEASPDALPVIRNVRANDHSAVVFTADHAKTLGVMYVVGKAEADLPDTWVKNAGIVWMKDGECNIPKLKNGDVVTFRAIASRLENAELTAQTADAFAFGDKLTFTAKGVRAAFSLPRLRKTYDRLPFELDASLRPKGSSVLYFKGKHQLSSPPVDVGDYIARVTVPAGDSTYLPGEYDVQLRVDPIRVNIFPLEASKQKGEPDPDFEFEYDTEAMLPGDVVTGSLTRVEGEAYGNYAYLTDSLRAPDYYRLVIDEASPSFFVDWNFHHYLPYDPFARIDPVFDVLRFSNGDTLSAPVRTNDLIKVGERYYGALVTDMLDGKERPVSASLRMRGGYDSALLILTADAELNEDGGYQTDVFGNRVLRGRRLTLSYSTMNGLMKQRIDDIAFSLDGVTVQFSLGDLYSNDKMEAWMRENGVTRVGSTFVVELEPISAPDALVEQELAATDALALGESLMRVGVWVLNGDARLDVAPYLTEARLSFDASPLLEAALARDEEAAEETQIVNGKVVTAPVSEEQARLEAAVAGVMGEVEATQEDMEVTLSLLSEQIERTDAALVRYADEALALETAAVVPYTQTETDYAAYSALMRTHPYMTVPFDANGLYGLRMQEPQSEQESLLWGAGERGGDGRM